jgi:predicted SAM-dependent methyltransferase
LALLQALLQECHRICSPEGIIRIVVPDADLRTYARLEPLGFPSARLSFSHPDKHKTRWSVYSLGIALELSGFRANPLRYCDKHGKFIPNEPAYKTNKNSEVANSLAYVIRPFSLIVDGIKT